MVLRRERAAYMGLVSRVAATRYGRFQLSALVVMVFISPPTETTRLWVTTSASVQLTNPFTAITSMVSQLAAQAPVIISLVEQAPMTAISFPEIQNGASPAMARTTPFRVIMSVPI